MEYFPLRRSLLAALAAAAVIVSALLVFAGSVSAAGPDKPAAAKKINRPAKVDRDRDRIFDDLEARLAKVESTDRVNVIVSLAADASTARVADVSRRVGGVTVGRRFSIVDGFSATVTKAQAEQLARVPGVMRVEENSVVRAYNDGAQASFGVTKARLDVPSLDGDADGQAGVYSPRDLVAAVIDTGIDTGHLDLDEGKVLAFQDFVNGRTSPYDDNGHGTHVAATIAGDGDARADRLYRGVAPEAGLVGLKVLDAAGSGTMANITAAIDWVVKNKDVYGIEAINLSLGASGCSDGTDATSIAVNNAEAAGLVVATAAGNDGPGACTIGTPGAAKGALTVGAMADTAQLGFSQAAFSSRGPTADGRVKPDISAAGVGISSAQHGTTNGYVAFDGTSMATPFVAGVALLMRDVNPGLTPNEIRSALVGSAIDWGRTGSDPEHGAGRLDAYAALKAAGAPLSVPPAVPTHLVREGSLTGTGVTVDYKLDVTTTEFPVAATLVIGNVSSAASYATDFDLYLYNPAGTLVDYAETVGRHEEVAVQPTATGTWTLRVRSYAGAGPYTVDISAGIGVDTAPPTVNAVAPADGAVGVAQDGNVSVTFSEPMSKSATQGAFKLGTAAGAAVTGAFSWNGNTLVFDPVSPLEAGTEYTATIGTGATDAAGNALVAAKTWTFKTAAAQPPSTTTTVFPSSVSIYYGARRAGDVTRLRADDSYYYEVNSTTSGTRVADWYGLLPATNGVKRLTVTYNGRASASCSQVLYVYNWTTSTWQKVDGRTIGTTDVTITVSPTGTLADFVSGASGAGDVAVRVRCSRSDGTNFFVRGDLLSIKYDA